MTWIDRAAEVARRHGADDGTLAFVFEGQKVRTFPIDNEPWFVLGDVCKVLGIANSRDAKNRLDGVDVGSTDIYSPLKNRTYPTTIINESGLYDVILDSRKPQAKRFRRWITADVIPSIRKTGSYTVSAATAPAIPQTMAEALRLAADECERADTATRELETAKPKVEFYDQCADADGTFTLTEAAKQLGWRPNVLMERMRDEGILYRQGDKNLPKQYYMDRGWFEVVMRRRNGYITRYPQTRVTPKGMTRIQEKFGKDDMQPYRARTVTKPNTYREVVSAPPKQQGRIAHDVTFGDMLKEFGVSYQEAVRELCSVQAVEYKSGGVYPKPLYEGYFLPEYHGRPVRLSKRIGITPHGVEFLRDIFGCTRVDFSNVRSLF